MPALALAPASEYAAFTPSLPFRSLSVERSPMVALRAANRIGKTRHACWVVARRAIEVPMSRCRVVGPSRAQVRDVMGRYLWEFLRPYLVSGSVYRPGTGWSRNGVILLANGSIIQTRSYQDDPDTQEGDELDLVVLDELPPPAHLEANLGRIADRKGQIIVCLTVQTSDTSKVERFRKRVEGEDKSPTHGRTEHATGWVQYVVPHTRENVPWKDAETFELQVGKYRGTDQETKRVHGSWEGPSDARKFQGWASRMVLSRAEMLDRLRGPGGRVVVDEVLYGIDHGEGDGKQCQYLIFRKGDHYHVVHEWVGGGGTTPTMNAQGMVDAVTEWLGKGVAGIYRISLAVGDINSAGPLGDGRSLNMMMMEALAKIYGTDESPIVIETPKKDAGFKDAREMAMAHAMIERRWWVIDTARRAIRAYQEYKGGSTDPHKDPIDAQGYAITQAMLTRQVAQVELHR